MITAPQLGDFARDGWLLLPGVLPAQTVAACLDEVRRVGPPGAGDRAGPAFDFPAFAVAPLLGEAFAGPAVSAAVAALLGAPTEPLTGCQVARTRPPFPRGAGRPHVDGTVGEPGGRPGTFSLLVGLVLTDQTGPGDGGLWVWPGSHREHAAHFAARGPEAFWDGDPGYPDVASAEPVQVRAAAGDVLLAHYLLGHCPGGVERRERVTVYARVSRHDHAARWRQAMTDWTTDFPALAG